MPGARLQGNVDESVRVVGHETVGAQPPAPSVPPPVTVPVYPTAQTVHELTDDCPAAAVEMPTGHAVQSVPPLP